MLVVDGTAATSAKTPEAKSAAAAAASKAVLLTATNPVEASGTVSAAALPLTGTPFHEIAAESSIAAAPTYVSAARKDIAALDKECEDLVHQALFHLMSI